MKLSISLSEDELATLDRFAEAAGLASRSAAVQQAIRRLVDPELIEAYSAAWGEWASSDNAADWDRTLCDGLIDSSRRNPTH